ncbi:discoidin domain-containing protein [bacterium]|nr:discoidin domain-containing protein [candidate division CSSED10-310 bacterium]
MRNGFRNLVVMMSCVLLAGWTVVASAETIAPVSVNGNGGEFNNAPSLLIDGAMATEEVAYNDPACVHWGVSDVFFVVDLGAVYILDGVTVQVDNNDDYVLETSQDGASFAAWTTVTEAMGEMTEGMDTVSTVKDHAEWVSDWAVKPVEARYVRLSARGGDEIYAVSEIMLTGTRVQTEKAAEEAVESIAAEVDAAAGEAGETVGDAAGAVAGEAANVAGDAVDAVGETVDAAGKAVEAAGEAVEAAGEAVETVGE